MASTLRARSRAAAVVVTSVALTALVAGPAAALPGRDLTYDDGEQRGTPMSVGTAFLVFVGIPLVVAALVWLLVKAPGWTRSGRANETDAWTGDPLAVGAPSAGEPAALDAGSDQADGTGGTSARW